ncbi:uncharacterized protein LOC112052441 [Bicyclus anynana]|uniref:Uncharacterized protein LOC112052441 n=1 Tax=Bicyclus anynana TaxID=110368 RepID=A0ABM3LTY3_BICAN|nr:uncharacterized protein LOC112052441 [Bicyclus anynana]
MAIKTYEKLIEKNGPKSSSISKFSNKNSQLTMKIDYTADDSISNCISKSDTYKRKINASPYLTEDRNDMLSRITEQRLVSKKTTDFISSYPMAVNIYKASSDEFKALKKSKKVKKSVLTLPNQPAPLPQVCTVSDMNESEYCENKEMKPKKKRTTQSKRKSRISKPMQIFNRDAEYCSRLNIDLDSSSTDMINQFPGDGKKSIKRRSKVVRTPDNNVHDVWAMVRKLNNLRFMPTPPFSEESIISLKKNGANKRRNNQMDTKVIETHTTEEFTYFTSLDDKSAHNSQSSLDCITVIGKQDDYQEFCEENNNNKAPLTIKNQKNIKKGKAKSILNSSKNIRRGKDNVENFHQDNMNLKHNNDNPKYSQKKVLNQNNKIILTHDFSKNTELGCQNTKKVEKEYNESDDQVHLCGKSDSIIGDFIKSFDGSTITFEDTSNKISFCESHGHINGITKVVLSKGQNEVEAKKISEPKRNTYLRTSMPSAILRPKSTQANIKKRLANIQFPLVILEKDQLTSAPFHVTHYEPPQFEGLDKAGWPFMKSWQKPAIINSKQENTNYVNDKSSTQVKKANENNIRKIPKEHSYLPSKDRDISVPGPPTNTSKINIKAQKTKPIQQFKERMLQFLHRKSSDDDNRKYMPKDHTKQQKSPNDDVNIARNAQGNFMLTNDQGKITYNDGNKAINHVPSKMKLPWSKGRLASEFIDNVMKKIKSGVYYNQDEKYLLKKRSHITREYSVQTEMNLTQYDFCENFNQKSNQNPNIEEICDTCDQAIPGFDDNPIQSDLQLETINKSKIAIKHCVTNIVVQFDVVMPYDVNNILHEIQSASCIPLTVSESHPKVFKAKTMIVNAILPAELCSILPNTMKKVIVDSQLLKIFDKGETRLSSGSTLPQTANLIKHFMPLPIDDSPKSKILRQGKFSNTIIAKNSSHEKIISSGTFQDFCTQQKNNLLPNIHKNQSLTYYIHPIIHPISLPIFESDNSSKLVPETDDNSVHQSTSSCTELQPYQSNYENGSVSLNNIESVSFKLIDQDFSIQVNILVNPFNGVLSYKNISTIMSIGVYTEESKANCVLSGMTLDSLYNGIRQHISKGNKTVTNMLKPKVAKCTQVSEIKKFENCKTSVKYCVPNNSNKKRTFNKLYKKCKSASNISIERTSTSLKKLRNLDDFFLAIGSAKTLASAIDGSAEKKILSSIKELKHWINEITPRQALLILLLANKKDTSNLVRYRPVILQGIAVNRITRATELDMEIEVIEKEKLNLLSPYEGISYLPASVENQDNLFEELYWIAKTTASDYQRPFDESSERLLKSLLEKRKKLNPSYLRVMARYVGLGLLKTPK